MTTGALASELGVSSPSATAMLKRLEDRPRRTPGRAPGSAHRRGERAALQVVRRHRLLETFLTEVVGLDWDEVHAEAELLEHVLSERLEQRIDELLDHPTRDPHGDPIPPRDGGHREDWGEPLATASTGDRFRVDRVSDRDSEALRYLGGLGVRPGAELRVDDVAPFGGPVWVVLGDGPGTRSAHR